MVIKSLVGGLDHFLFSHILGIIIPIDFHIFQVGRYTTNQILFGTDYFCDASADARPYPRFLPPLQRLITRHPRLFVDALKDELS